MTRFVVLLVIHVYPTEKDIMRRWEPFHHGASSADRLDNLYPHIYRVPVVARGMGLREDYSVTLPASTPKENFLQIIDDDIQVRIVTSSS